MEQHEQRGGVVERHGAAVGAEHETGVRCVEGDVCHAEGLGPYPEVEMESARSGCVLDLASGCYTWRGCGQVVGQEALGREVGLKQWGWRGKTEQRQVK